MNWYEYVLSALCGFASIFVIGAQLRRPRLNVSVAIVSTFVLTYLIATYHAYHVAHAVVPNLNVLDAIYLVLWGFCVLLLDAILLLAPREMLQTKD